MLIITITQNHISITFMIYNLLIIFTNRYVNITLLFLLFSMTKYFVFLYVSPLTYFGNIMVNVKYGYLN